MSTFTSLNTAASGMNAARTALDVIANNIANANTEGYKRQVVTLSDGRPPIVGLLSGATVGMAGTGVEVTAIRRVQDEFLDSRIIGATTEKARWETARDALTSVEALMDETGDSGISGLIDRFWNSWRELAASPESVAPRQTVVSSAIEMTDRIRELSDRLKSTQVQIGRDLAAKVENVNSLATEIAEVNEKIVALASGEAAPNDLLNRRDALVQELAGLVDVQAHGDTGSDFILNVNGVTLVQGVRTREMSLERLPDGTDIPIWTDGPGPVNVASGQIRAILDVRDSYLADYSTRLDRVAEALITQVNALHSSGYGMSQTSGVPFFTGTGAADMRVNQAVVSDNTLVAASATGGQSNAEVAQAIADLSQQALIGSETISQSYRSIVSKLGADVSLAERTASTRQFTLDQLTNQRNSISGVSLDDEMVDMVRFQQAFAASARIFEATDGLLQTLLESL